MRLLTTLWLKWFFPPPLGGGQHTADRSGATPCAVAEGRVLPCAATPECRIATHASGLSRKAQWGRAILVAACLLLLLRSCLAPASEIDERRVRISLEIFPRIVAVDQDLRDKVSDKDKVRLFVIYDHDADSAQRVMDTMRNSITNIGGRGVEFVVLSAAQSAQDGLQRPSAVFIAETLSDTVLSQLLQQAIKKRVLVFSPFAGDVERGVTVGIAISSRIKPFFNVPTLRQSHININEKLLSISQRYE